MKRRLLAGLCALALVTGARAAPPSPASAKAFVERLYRAAGLETFDYHSVRFAPALAALIRRDEASSSRTGTAGALEANPFCECQDTAEDYRLLSSSVAPRGPNGARVIVSVRNEGLKRFVVDVDWIGGGWRVADVQGPESGSLLAYLRREVPREEAAEKRL